MYQFFTLKGNKIKATIFIAIICIISTGKLVAQKTYDVGPGFAKTLLSQVPWNTLAAGDVVNIHYDVNPYHEKFLISTSGTPAQPIKIIGIAGPNGEKPIIDGDHANAISGQICYAQTQQYGLIFIEPGNAPNGSCPFGSYAPIPHDIVIDNLEIRNAHPNFTFSVDGGAQQAYAAFSCGIYAERVQDLVVRNCNFNHCGLGLFINSKFGIHALSQNILVERNTFTQNGIVGDGHDHNSYIEAVNVVYQYNYYDALVVGSYGASIKDRSAGNIFRYNWINASGGHAIQIAEPQGGLGLIDQLPSYRQTYVYGNVIFNGKDGAGRIIRYGGDQGIYANYRQGTLYFYNNTLIDEGDKYQVPGATRYNTSIFLLPDYGEVGNVPIKEIVDCRNNIFYNQAATPGVNPTTLEILSTDLSGTVNMINNWLSPGVTDKHTYFGSPSNAGVVNHSNTTYGNNGLNNPGFNGYAAQDYTLSAFSNAIDGSTALSAAAVNYPVLEQYVKQLTSQPRNIVGVADLGAYESSFAPPVLVSSVSVAPSTVQLLIGQTSQLSATVLPANASNKTISWGSGNNAIATVTAQGLVTAISAGTVAITVTTQDGNRKAIAQVTIKVPVTGITVAPISLLLNAAQTSALVPAVMPANATNKVVSWVSSNVAIATVSAAGVVTGVSTGAATITVTTQDGGFTATSQVTVKVPVKGVSVTPASITINVGQTTPLTAAILPANATNKTVTWVSNNNALATVSAAGVVTGLIGGTATITVTTQDGNYKGSCTVTITSGGNIPATGVSVTPPSMFLGIGQTAPLAATVLPANASNKNIGWASSNTTVATVSAAGAVTAIAQGTATITATTQSGNFKATSQVTVTQVQPLSDTVVKWDFKNQTQFASAGMTANLTAKLRREDTYSGVYSYSEAGLPGGAGKCQGTTNWDSGVNTRYWITGFATTGFYNMKFWSAQRSSVTGPRDFTIQYRVGIGGAWTNLVNVVDSMGWPKGIIANVAMPASCSNQPVIFVRWLLTSSAAPNGTLLKAAGAGLIDEVIVTGDTQVVKQANALGVSNVSKLVSNEVPATNMVAYPNPVHSDLHINITLTQPSAVRLSLSDMSGKILAQWISPGINSYHETIMHLAKYAAGMYILVLDGKNERIVKKVLKTN